MGCPFGFSGAGRGSRVQQPSVRWSLDGQEVDSSFGGGSTGLAKVTLTAVVRAEYTR